MLNTPKLLALAFGTAIGLGVGTGVLAVAGRGPFAPPAPPPVPQQTPEQWAAIWKLQRDDAFAALCTRVAALPAQRPFDRALLRPQPPITAEEELAALLRELEAAETQFHRGLDWQCWKHGEALSERLAIFPWRFGQDPRVLDGWAPIAAAARRMVADIEHVPSELALNEADSYAALFRAQLLDLAGRTDEAGEALAAVKAQHWCGNCAAERMGVVERRRSEAAERRGNLPTALALLDDFSHASFDFRLLLIDDDITLARYGLLLLQTGRDADGRCVLQLVAELRPGTPGAEVARAALDQMGALREPTLERLHQVWIDGADENDAYRKWAVQSIAALPIPDRFERLAALHEQGDRAALAGLIALRDERTRPILGSALLEGDLWSAQDVLLGLHALQGGAGRYVRPLLERVAKPGDPKAMVNNGALDEALRSVCGGGPELTRDELNKDATFAQAWLAWLQDH